MVRIVDEFSFVMSFKISFIMSFQKKNELILKDFLTDVADTVNFLTKLKVKKISNYFG